MAQVRNIKSYAAYLEEKVAAYRELKRDYIKEGDTISIHLRNLSWKEGLGREIEILQRQLKVLLESKFYLDSVDNDVTLEALRLLVHELFRLFQLVNEAVISLLRSSCSSM